jgi:phage-related holin
MLKLLRLEDLKITAVYSLLAAPLVNLFAPVQHLFLPLLWLVIIDIVTGIYKNRIHNKQPITSRKFYERKAKVVILWLIGLITFLLADKFLLELNIEGHWGAKVFCIWYALYETISIMENLGECGLKGAKQILSLLRGKLPSNIDKTLEDAKGENDED